MKMSIVPSSADGEVTAVSSKSYAIRAVLAAATLSCNPVNIYGVFDCEDVLTAISCLTDMGARIEKYEKYLTVYPIKKPVKNPALYVNESAATYRFLLPVSAALGINARFVLAKSLENRPIAPLLEALKPFGITYSDNVVQGKLKTDEITVDGSLSSQFVSGLMFALSVINKKSVLTVTGNVVSEGYIDMTKEVLKSFGVTVTKDENRYYIERKPIDAEKYFVEGDWSGAAFHLCAGAIKGVVTVKGLNMNSLQKDKAILDVLSSYGAEIIVENDCVTVKSNRRNPFTFNAGDCPDLVPALAVIAAYAEGKSEIKGVSRLKIKESDRISEIISMLDKAKIKAEFSNDKIIVYGGKVYGGNFISADHRIVMASAILARFAEKESVVFDANAVKKSCPGFFDDYKLTGGNFCVDMAR